jgi:hypothetical protein
MSTASFTAIELMQRVRQLQRALAGHELLEHPEWFRFAALAALTGSLNPDEVARALRDRLAELHEHTPWSDALRSPLRFAIAANLVIEGQATSAFIGKVQRSRKLINDAMTCRDDIAELSSILILHTFGGAIDAPRVQFLARVHDCMHTARVGHNGAGEMPASALLTCCPGSAEDIVNRVETIHDELRRKDFAVRARLHSAAVVLATTDLYANDAVKRCLELAGSVDRQAGPECREAITMLSLLEHDPEVVAGRFADVRHGVGDLCVGAPVEVAAALAADIVFMDLVRFDKFGRRITRGPEFEGMQRRVRKHRAAAVMLARSTAELSTRTDIEWLISRYLSA